MRIRNFISKNYKLVIGFIIGGIVFGGIGVYAVTTKEVSYDNSTSKLTSTNMQGAIDELNTKATTKINEAKNECPSGYICSIGGSKVSTINTNIVKAYSYDQVNSATKCITGEESTCKETNCIRYLNKKSCPAGTIIKYKVNSSTIKYFYVLHDDGATMTLQQRENTVDKVVWNSSSDVSQGPIIALPALESATSSWTNVNVQSYQMGTTNFNGTNAYTECNDRFQCNENSYTLGNRTVRARMITLQEAVSVGCTISEKSCSIYMYNYLVNSTNSGGTINNGTGYGYWTMSTNPTSGHRVWFVFSNGIINFNSYAAGAGLGARAVVVINK